MTETKEFDIASVLSITTGRLFGDIGGVYDILGFMTGEEIYTHQIQRAMDACLQNLIQQFPELSEDVLANAMARIDGTERDDRPRVVNEVLEDLSNVHGKRMVVRRLESAANPEWRDPIQEL